MNHPAAALARTLAALDKLEIAHFVGGSVASSVYGIVRATNDIDIVADIRAEQAADFVTELGEGFYADADAIRAAIEHGRPFNVIHLDGFTKIDIFPAGAGAFEQRELARRTVQSTDLFGEEMEFPVASPEDILLAKLRWHRLGGGTSAQQWNDVRGILCVMGDRLDREYLRHWAAQLGLSEALEELLGEDQC